MDAIFAPEEGRLFARFPGAEERPGQRRMAELVWNAIADGDAATRRWKDSGSDPTQRPDAVVQAIEAGTGTGKSLGYLLPSLMAGRTPVLVATRTKQLQRQLLEEDLPRATGILDRPVKAVIAKGRANYLCKLAWEEIKAHPPSALTREDYALWSTLQTWTPTTEDGDRESLGRHGEGESELWDKINARAERCIGKQCAHYETCFLTVLRQELSTADLIIANHALLLADRVLRESEFGGVLPDAPVLVLDEAHELEEALSSACAEVWTSRAMSLLYADLEAAALHPEAGALDALLPPWVEAWQNLLALVPLDLATWGLDSVDLPLGDLGDAVAVWIETGVPLLQELASIAARDKEDPTWPKLGDRLKTAFSRMEHIFAPEEGRVSTLQREGPHSVTFTSHPVDVRPLFHQHLRRGFETLILTSATLRDGKGFNGLGLRLGLTKEEVAAAEHVESPFDFENQGLLFVPPGLPERRPGANGVGTPEWVEGSLEAMVRLVRASKGRALLLFTSRKMLAAFRPRLESACPELTFFVQGEGFGRQALVERFRQTPMAVLLGLASFWQGVDLPGDALSLVVITALPFAPPDDPVLAARIRQANEVREGLGFVGIQVPQMTLKLKQGLGRLIRTRSDRGVVAIMDPRLLLPHEDPSGKRYAAQVRASLPPFPIVRDWTRVEEFLRTL
jgi:ATP-dependent DNA helicase DinG